VRWNLRLAAAHKGIWTASDLQRRLAERGMVISAGKMSGLWSGQPASIKLGDLDVLCAVLAVSPNELLLPEPDIIPGAPAQPAEQAPAVGSSPAPTVRPRTRDQRSLPPEP